MITKIILMTDYKNLLQDKLIWRWWGMDQKTTNNNQRECLHQGLEECLHRMSKIELKKWKIFYLVKRAAKMIKQDSWVLETWNPNLILALKEFTARSQCVACFKLLRFLTKLALLRSLALTKPHPSINRLKTWSAHFHKN